MWGFNVNKKRENCLQNNVIFRLMEMFIQKKKILKFSETQ